MYHVGFDPCVILSKHTVIHEIMRVFLHPNYNPMTLTTLSVIIPIVIYLSMEMTYHTHMR